MEKLINSLKAAIGSRYLKTKNQLVFVEWNGGTISRLDLIRRPARIISSGTTILKGTWSFNCENGAQGDLNSPFDIWWEQIDAVRRQIVPLGTCLVSNLGPVKFNTVTPAVMQQLKYTNEPICGNNNRLNKLKTDDVFCVKTREGNYSKIQVLAYGYNLKIRWITYRLRPAYSILGGGYINPEDIAVLADEKTAYISERGGNILKVNLSIANRAAASVVCSGLKAPHQIWLDENHNQAYVVEFANPGRILRIDLASHSVTPVYSSLNLGIGLVLTSDLKFAYVSEQGTMSVNRIDLSTGAKDTVASGLTNPFFLCWADSSETNLLVAERDPANRISKIDLSNPASPVTPVMTGTGVRPSSVSMISPGKYCICCDSEIDCEDIIAGITTTGIYKGIGFIPWNLIQDNGKADTTPQPATFQFPKDSPFGGSLHIMIDHRRAWLAGYSYYRVSINDIPWTGIWTDLRLNPVNGKYEIAETFSTQDYGPSKDGLYSTHNPAYVYMNSDLGCILDSSKFPDGKQSLKVEFFKNSLINPATYKHNIYLDNNKCVAMIDMPLLNGYHADTLCGFLKYSNKTHSVSINYVASHPYDLGSYSLSIVKGANTFDVIAGNVQASPYTYSKTVGDLLQRCNIAAFSAHLYVATNVINGIGRQSQYDASAIIAFCLAP